ncbi:uncharacterized protein [Pocillopora verrucosa]|uniref:uncharacterized protein n=1 Tax=Pocillopora verrucosa TaxID=203993 RepID=UPI003341B17E
MVWDFRSTAVLSNQIYQEAFTCTCLKVHPYDSHFVAQSNGDYIALFSTRKPYKPNKFERYEGHKVVVIIVDVMSVLMEKNLFWLSRWENFFPRSQHGSCDKDNRGSLCSMHRCCLPPHPTQLGGNLWVGWAG